MKLATLRRIILVFVAVIVFVVAYRVLTTSTIDIKIANGVSPLNTRVLVDGKEIAPHGKGGGEYSTKASMGTHKVVVRSSGFAEHSQDVTTNLRSHKSLEITLAAISAEDLAANLYDDPETEIVAAKFYGNNDWMVFIATGGEGSIVIANKDQQSGAWTIIDEGTDIDTSTGIYSGAPAEMLSYLESL